MILRLHFNESCCIARGVPEQCMGLCREKVDDRSIDVEGRNVQMVMPVDQCVEHRDTIRTCMVEEGKILARQFRDRTSFKKCAQKKKYI